LFGEPIFVFSVALIIKIPYILGLGCFFNWDSNCFFINL